MLSFSLVYSNLNKDLPFDLTPEKVLFEPGTNTSESVVSLFFQVAA